MRARYYLSVGGDIGGPESINLHNGEATFIGRNPDFNDPGRVRLPLIVIGQSASQRADTTNAILRLLRRAPLALAAGSAITLSVQRAPGLRWLHYDLLGTADGDGPERALRVEADGRHAALDLDLRTTRYPRLDPVTLTIPGTLAGATAAFLVPDVPGSIPALGRVALDDTSPTGVINRVRLATISGAFDAATDYTAWVDTPATTPATNTSQAGTLGGQYAAHPTPLTSLTHTEIARAVQPAGTSQQGLLDGYLRVMGTGTAIGTPGSLTATVTAPEARTEESSRYALIALGQTGSGRGTSPITDTVTATWSGTTTAGSLLLAVCTAEVTPASGAVPTGGGTWRALTTLSVTSEAGNEIYLYLYYQRGAAAQSGVVTWAPGATTNPTPTDPLAMQLLELVNADLLFQYNGASDTANTAEPVGVQPVDSAFANEFVLALFALATNTTADPTDFWYGGYEPLFGGNGMLGGYRIIDSAGTTPAVPKVRLNATYDAWLNLNLHVKPQQTSESTTTYTEPTPGELAVGSYIARVQAEDAAGYRGNAIAVTGTPTVATDRSKITYNWPAVTSGESYVLTIQHAGRNYEVKTEAITYDLTTLDGLPEVDALPALTGALAPPPVVRARVGTVNDHTFSKVMPEEVALAGTGDYELVTVFARQQLPPAAPSLVDDWPDWAVALDGRSANGRPATIRVDGLWVVPSDHPGLEAHIHGRLYASKRRWILESLRDGIGAAGRLEHLTTNAERGRLTVRGPLLFAPGSTIVLLAFEQEGGDHSFAAQVTATVTYWPRVRWDAGAG